MHCDVVPLTMQQPIPQCAYYMHTAPPVLVGGLCRWQSGCKNQGEKAAIASICTHWSIFCKHSCLHTLSAFALRPEEGFVIPLSLTTHRALPLAGSGTLVLDMADPMSTIHIHLGRHFLLHTQSFFGFHNNPFFFLK